MVSFNAFNFSLVDICGLFLVLSKLPIAKCRENYVINTNLFSNISLIILVPDDSKGHTYFRLIAGCHGFHGLFVSNSKVIGEPMDQRMQWNGR
jgi:hypothetical protein